MPEQLQINNDKKGQTLALYKPKLKLSGGYIHFNETPDIVQVANSLIKLNNGVDLIASGLASMNPAFSTAASQLNQTEYKDDGLNYSSVKLSFEQPLYTGGKITGVNKQVDISIDISELEKKKSISDITFETKKLTTT